MRIEMWETRMCRTPSRLFILIFWSFRVRITFEIAIRGMLGVGRCDLLGTRL